MYCNFKYYEVIVKWGVNGFQIMKLLGDNICSIQLANLFKHYKTLKEFQVEDLEKNNLNTEKIRII